MSNKEKVAEKLSATFGTDVANDNLSRFADETLVIDKSDRAWWPTRFMLGQAGGYDSQYYTASEAKSATAMAAAKFVSVSFATYAFMKAVNPAFNSEAIQNLPSINGIDPKLIATGVAATALWWGISKLDTAVLHNMRSSKAAKEVFNEFGIDNEDAKKRNIPGYLLRLGISVGSLGITIPALMVTVSEDTIDQYLLETRYNEPNNAIVEEYRGRLETVEEVIARLTASRASLQTNLTELEETGRVVTPTQESRLTTLAARLATLTQQKTEEEARLLEQERARDLAEDRIRQEREGIRGSVAGCRPEVPVAPNCDAAMADRDLALAQIETITVAIERYDQQIGAINLEIGEINQAILEQTQSSNAAVQRERETLSAQIEGLTAQIGEEESRRSGVSDVNALAQADPRYQHFNPDLAEHVEGYIEYMWEEANALEWGRAAATALIIICLELGVFAMAASRKLNPGEMRGYLADLAKSEQAVDIFKQVKEKRDLEDSSLEGTNGLIRRKLQIEEAQAELFAEALQKAKDDPAVRESILNDVMAYFEEIRQKTDFNSKNKNTHTPS